MSFFKQSRLVAPQVADNDVSQDGMDIDLIELHRFVASVASEGLHLHRHSVPNRAGLLYRWVVISNVTKGRGKKVCGTNRCYKLRLKNIEAAEGS